jgi:hypothetical protein
MMVGLWGNHNKQQSCIVCVVLCVLYCVCCIVCVVLCVLYCVCCIVCVVCMFYHPIAHLSHPCFNLDNMDSSS